MKLNRHLLVVAGGVAALAVGSAGIAHAVGGGSEGQISGPVAERAGTSALDAVGGGTVLEIEREDGDGSGLFEVEVRRADGSQVEVHLDASYRPVGSTPDDSRAGSDDDDGQRGSDD